MLLFMKDMGQREYRMTTMWGKREVKDMGEAKREVEGWRWSICVTSQRQNYSLESASENEMFLEPLSWDILFLEYSLLNGQLWSGITHKHFLMHFLHK